MDKLRPIGIRLLQTIPSIIAVSLLSFFLLRFAPGDPARVIAGPRASDETVETLRESMGLDQPILVQYWHYVQRAVTGDFGQNLTGSSSVSEIVADGAVVTIWLAITSIILMLAISLPLAILAARKPDGVVDTIVRVFSVGGLALPSFWVGLMLIVYVAVPTGWFPVGGWPDEPAARLQAVVLPALTLTISLAPILVRSLRSALIEVLGSDYVLAAKAASVAPSRVLSSYVVRNAMLPSVPLFAIIVSFLLGGTVIVESVFSLPGLGQRLVAAVSTRDANLVQGITLVLGTSIVLIYLAADVALSFIDPRVRNR